MFMARLEGVQAYVIVVVDGSSFGVIGMQKSLRKMLG
jgi:hypothetical protein